MTSRTAVRGWHRTLIALLIAAMATSQVSVVLAGNYRTGAVGGVVIQIDGVVQNATADQRAALAQLRSRGVPATGRRAESRGGTAEDFAQGAGGRLRPKALRENSGKLPDEIRYLGGLLRVQYVFVYPGRERYRAGRSRRGLEDRRCRQRGRRHDRPTGRAAR